MTKQWANELASRILLGLTPTHPELWRSHIVSVLSACNAHEPLEQWVDPKRTPPQCIHGNVPLLCSECPQGASRDASPAIGPPLCNCQDGECHGPDVAQAYGHLCRAEDEPKPFCAKHPNTAFADIGCPFCGTPPTSRTGE